jgi:DNA invertase Pin-like site-specific DNA recombinase
MKVWLYYRLSRDEDEELNSLNNQRKIIYGYAVSNGHEIVGESFDDNISGMHFNRPGIDKIYEAVEGKLIEAVIVKDLSRLGRHRTQTALFIDYLREHNVRVLSATENIDTCNENDDLIVGFKGLINDFYARDIGKKIRSGYRQKQKEGIVITPPFGYYKDKNAGQIIVVPEAADTVREIFSAYLSGVGLKTIARQLNEEERKTPARMQLELMQKHMPDRYDHVVKKYLWDATMVGRILHDESYIGTLICHKSERNKINRTFRYTEPDEQYRHENYFPVIIAPELWSQVQILITQRKEQNVRAAPGQPIHRYSGLLRCADCGRTFIGKRVNLKDGQRVEYTCDSYHRFGKAQCSSHTVREEELDLLLRAELLHTKEEYARLWAALEQRIAQWTPKESAAQGQITVCQEKIRRIEEELEAILMERIRDKDNEARYDRMIQKREAQLVQLQAQITELENISAVLRKRQASLRKDISMMDSILADGVLGEAQLRMLIEKILVHEENGAISLEFRIRAPFQAHTECFDDGLTLERIGELLREA